MKEAPCLSINLFSDGEALVCTRHAPQEFHFHPRYRPGTRHNTEADCAYIPRSKTGTVKFLIQLIKTPLLHILYYIKNSSTAYIVLYKWIDTWFLDSNRRVGVWSLPWRWHILSIPLTTGRGTSAETCGLDDVFPPDDLGSRPETLC